MKTLLGYSRDLILSMVDWFYKPFQNYIPKETFRYGATGGFNTVLDIYLYFCSYHFILGKRLVDLGFVVISPHIAAFLLVFPITFSTGFFLARYITFTESPIRGRVQLFRYMLTVAGAIFLNYLLLKFFVEYLLIWPTISKIITTVFAVAYSYAMQRYFTFQTGTLTKKLPVKVKQ